MASGTTYGSTYATSSGKNFIKSYITWSTSDTATATTFTFTAGCHVDSGYVTNAQITVACLGQSKTVDDKGWGSGNHQMISGSTSWSKSTSAQTKTVTCTLTLANGNKSVATVSVTVPALASYAVTYNANGTNVSGMPSNQTKYYNTALTLSGAVPLRVGYTFLRWNTDASGTGTNYNPSATYPASSNAGLTLYAIWQADTYTVTYDANGGTGTETSQTKTHDVDLTLSEGSNLSKSLHTLEKWNTSANGTGTDYAKGGTYTINSAVTLYAQWHLDYIQSAISNFVAYRSDSSGNADDTGQYIHIAFNYVGGSDDGGATRISPEIIITIGTSEVYDTIQSSGSGPFSQTFGTFSENNAWNVHVVATDSYGVDTEVSAKIPSATFPIDIYSDGSAMGVMHPADANNKLTTAPIVVDGAGKFNGKITGINGADISGINGDVVAISNTGTGQNTYFGVTYGNMDLHVGVDSSGTVAGIWSNALNDWVLITDGNVVNLPTSLNIGWSPVADYVIEQGTETASDSTVWHIRKWKSGTTELWARKTFASVPVTTSSAVYGGYRSAVIEVALPASISLSASNSIDLQVTKSVSHGAWLNYATISSSYTAVQAMLSAGSSMTETSSSLNVHITVD